MPPRPPIRKPPTLLQRQEAAHKLVNNYGLRFIEDDGVDGLPETFVTTPFDRVGQEFHQLMMLLEMGHYRVKYGDKNTPIPNE